jgi:hypothetical protein
MIPALAVLAHGNLFRRRTLSHALTSPASVLTLPTCRCTPSACSCPRPVSSVSSVLQHHFAHSPPPDAPTLLRRRAKALTKHTGKAHISQLDLHLNPNDSFFVHLKTNLTRPFVLLFTEKAVFLFSLYAAILCMSAFGRESPTRADACSLVRWNSLPHVCSVQLSWLDPTNREFENRFGAVPIVFQRERGWGSGIGSLRAFSVL